VSRRRPNMRLKLSAPAPNGSLYEADVRCCRIPFVNSLAWRRSLSAIR
jgi:hypothetical protein